MLPDSIHHLVPSESDDQPGSFRSRNDDTTHMRVFGAG